MGEDVDVDVDVDEGEEEDEDGEMDESGKGDPRSSAVVVAVVVVGFVEEAAVERSDRVVDSGRVVVVLLAIVALVVLVGVRSAGGSLAGRWPRVVVVVVIRTRAAMVENFDGARPSMVCVGVCVWECK